MASLYNPEFRSSILIRNVCYVVASIPWIISIFLPEYRELLWWLSAILDLVLSNAAFYIIEMAHCKFRVAVNIEHHTERLGLLTLIVVGESHQ